MLPQGIDWRRAVRSYAPQMALWLAYTPDRQGEHPQGHLGTFIGALKADCYAGFDMSYGKRPVNLSLSHESGG
jgi:hypothetical protein